MFSTGYNPCSALLFFSIHLTLSLCTVFDTISSNIDEALSIKPSANVIVFGDFNVHHKDWLTSSGGNNIHAELRCTQMEIIETLSNHYGNTLRREVYIRDLRLECLSSRCDIILKQFQ